MRKFGFKKMAAIAAIVVASAAQAGAASLDGLLGPDGAVFDKSFSADFLKKHENQQVQSIRFEQFPKVESKTDQLADVSGVDFAVTVKFRDSDKNFEAAGMCFAGEEGMNCRISCDDSGFFLKADEAGKSILLLNLEGFELNGCSDTNVNLRTLKSDPDNAVYKLDPVSQG